MSVAGRASRIHHLVQALLHGHVVAQNRQVVLGHVTILDHVLTIVDRTLDLHIVIDLVLDPIVAVDLDRILDLRGAKDPDLTPDSATPSLAVTIHMALATSLVKVIAIQSFTGMTAGHRLHEEEECSDQTGACFAADEDLAHEEQGIVRTSGRRGSSPVLWSHVTKMLSDPAPVVLIHPNFCPPPTFTLRLIASRLRKVSLNPNSVQKSHLKNVYPLWMILTMSNHCFNSTRHKKRQKF